MKKRLVLLAVACVSGYVLFTSFNVRTQAAWIAAGAPYCVQVRDGREYRPALGMADTLGLFMRGSGGHHHAVLAVGNLPDPVTYHWSYLGNRFVEGTYGPFPVVCTPLREFFANPARYRDDGRLRFALLGRIVAIPREYRPSPQWPGDGVGYFIDAAAPDFMPVSKDCAKRHCGMVFVDFTDAGKRRAMWPREAERYRAGDAGSLYGLVHIRDAGDDRYLELDQDGKVITSISCLKGGTGCRHEYSDGEAGYSFPHPREDLPRWRLMQRRLVRLHAGFLQVPARH